MCDQQSRRSVYTGSSESTLVKMPHCWKSHVAAQVYLLPCEKRYQEDPVLVRMFIEFIKLVEDKR